jgi:DNA-binding protein HU-beta
MAKQKTKSQIVEHLSDKTDLPKKTVNQFLDELAALAYKEAKNGFTLHGLGKLVLVNRKARMGRNPQTGEALKIPAKRVLKFRVAKAAKDAVLGGK